MYHRIKIHGDKYIRKLQNMPLYVEYKNHNASTGKSKSGNSIQETIDTMALRITAQPRYSIITCQMANIRQKTQEN